MTLVIPKIGELPPNVIACTGLMLLLLMLGSLVRIGRILLQQEPPALRKTRLDSLSTWWVIFGVLVLCMLVGWGLLVIVFAIVSAIGLWEYRRLAKSHHPIPQRWYLILLAIPVHYGIVYTGRLEPFWTFVPVWVLVIMTTRLVLTGNVKGFLVSAGITFFGLMLIVYLLSHAVMVFALPHMVNPVAGPWGLFLFLVLLTAVNDIAQALWGRALGRHKITPHVSPNKTWEGLVLGALTTISVGCLTAPYLTPFADQPMTIEGVSVHLPYVSTVGISFLIAIGGFLGDITMSAIKRDVGVKDSSDLLPGQGGLLDRVDSLTFTAPIYFYYLHIAYGSPGVS